MSADTRMVDERTCNREEGGHSPHIDATITINLNTNGLYIEVYVTINVYGAGQAEASVTLHHLNYTTPPSTITHYCITQIILQQNLYI